jgi:hypothetical protein
MAEHRQSLADRMIDDPRFCDPELAGWTSWGFTCSIHGGHFGASRSVLSMGPAASAPNLLHADPDQLTRRLLNVQYRLRRVQLMFGDWRRAISPARLQTCYQSMGIFLDPPYIGSADYRLYSGLSCDIAQDVAAWCIEQGEDPKKRIVLAGHEGDYDLPGWRSVPIPREYGTMFKGSADRDRLYLSPHCLDVETPTITGPLFADPPPPEDPRAGSPGPQGAP